jgi:hypothetical protein
VIGSGEDPSLILAALRAALHQRFGIDHLTLQLEPRGFEEQGCCG